MLVLQNASDKASSLGLGSSTGGKAKVGLGLGLGTKEREREKSVGTNVPVLTVNLLVEALQQTIEFEIAMERKFGVPVSLNLFLKSRGRSEVG